MNMLVTGADGFLGLHLVARLPKTADIFLHCGLAESVGTFRLAGFSNVSHGDLAAPFQERGLPDCAVTTLVHLAGLPGGDESDLVRANVDVTTNVLAWARSRGIGKVVFASTAAIYGDTCRTPATEDSTLDPQTPYALSKYRAEQLLEAYAADGATAIALRMPHVYGVGKHVGVLAAIVAHATSDSVVRLDGDGHEKRDFIYIDDAITAILAACETEVGRGFNAYNIGSGKSLSLREVCRLVGNVVGNEVRVELTGQPAGRPHCIQLDISKAGTELQWAPKVDIEKGIRRML